MLHKYGNKLEIHIENGNGLCVCQFVSGKSLREAISLKKKNDLNTGIAFKNFAQI